MVTQPGLHDKDLVLWTQLLAESLNAAILDAAWAELQDVGYPGLTMERVASRAGTSKPVIYRRCAPRGSSQQMH